MFARKLKKRQSNMPPPPPSNPIVYELPPIEHYLKNDLGDLSTYPTLKSSSASIRSMSKAPVKNVMPQFHKPSRLQSSSPPLAADSSNTIAAPDTIASLYSRDRKQYTSSDDVSGRSGQPGLRPPESLPKLPRSPSLHFHKRPKIAPTFNLAVIGSRKTGKTSFIRALLSRCEFAHPAESVAGEQDIKRFQSFGAAANSGRPKTTDFTEALHMEILDFRGDRLTLTCVDSPGWDKDALGEMKAELVVNNFIKACELRFTATFDSENAVRRTSARPDTHIHCVLYFIDPDGFLRSSANPSEVRSHYTKSVSSLHCSQSVTSKAGASDSDDLPLHTLSSGISNGQELLTSTLDLRMIKKISKRATVLPIIAKADTLTKEQLREVKETLTKDLKREGLDYGVLEPLADADASSSAGETHPSAVSDISHAGTAIADGALEAPSAAINVPRSLSAPHLGNGLPLQRTRSRRQSLSRRRRTLLNDPEAVPPPPAPTARVAQHLPFAVIAPEALPMSATSPLIREYPWGVINVTDPDHSDFGLVSQCLLHHHLRSFREATKTFYETFRTEQLVARRLT